MKKKIIAVLVLMFGMASGSVIAHSGGTDTYGCHMNHKTGVYHCH